MSFTGRIGSADSELGSIVLGTDTFGATDNQSANNTLAFVSSATQITDHVLSVTSTLSLSDSSYGGAPRLESATSTLVLIDSAVEVEDDAENASSVLAFADSATLIRDIAVSATSTLTLTDDTRSSIFMLNVTDQINFSHSASPSGAIRVFAANQLGFAETFDGHRGDANEEISDFLVFSDTAGLTFAFSLSHNLSLTDFGARFTGVFDVLSFVQTVSAGKGDSLTSDLGLTDAVALQYLARRSVTNVLTINQAATYLVINACVEKHYTPFVGASSDSSLPPPTPTIPTIDDGTLTLTYPFTSPTSTVILRNPQFGNRDILTFNRINRETRGGTLIVFADSKWPKMQTLKVTLTQLSGQQADDMETFLAISLGREIGLLDHENRKWRGIVTTPDAEVSQPGRFDRSISFEFEGALA